MTRSPVRLEAEAGVGVIVIDNPPVNALSRAVRSGLVDALRALAANPSLHAGVIVGAGRIFISGADINEFSGPVEQPDLPAVVAEIENCPKPVVAAIAGAALGGGLEVALACDLRIAAADAEIGFPEVTLGVIPGAGGTQRLPRLVGVARATAMIAGGKRIAAIEAEDLGILDGTVPAESLRTEAIARAREVREKRRVSLLPVPPEAMEQAPAVDEQRKRARTAAARAAIDVVALAATVPFREAVARERETFLALRSGDEAAALRHLFFAERAAARFEAEGARPPPVATVGIVGAGTMGAGIAAAFAAAGVPVMVYDEAAAARERAVAAVKSALNDLGRPDAGVAFADRLAALADRDLIVEAVFEDIAVKTAVMRELGRLAKPEAILATNTSYLDPEAIAAAGGRPERSIGLHFFAPAHRMKLVEVVPVAATAPATVIAALGIAKRLRKVPVVAGPGEGFIGNRIFARYRAQAEFLLEEGATPREVDAAAESLGFAMGPFAVSDLSGLDVAWRLRKSKAAARDPRERYVPVADRLCEMGRLGRKAGAGWYDYGGETGGRGRDSPVVAAILDELRPRRYRTARVDEATIGRRLLGAIVNEAANVIADGIARAPGDIDVVFVNGYGFARSKGGPLFQAARLPRAEVEAMIDLVQESVGFGFQRGDVARVLSPAASGR